MLSVWDIYGHNETEAGIFSSAMWSAFTRVKRIIVKEKKRVGCGLSTGFCLDGGWSERKFAVNCKKGAN